MGFCFERPKGHFSHFTKKGGGVTDSRSFFSGCPLIENPMENSNPNLKNQVLESFFENCQKFMLFLKISFSESHPKIPASHQPLKGEHEEGHHWTP